MHRFQQTLDELNSNLRDIEAERLSLDEQETAIRTTIDGLERLIALESGASSKIVKESKLRANTPKASKKSHGVIGRPKTEQSKIKAGVSLVRKGATVGSAASAVGVHRNTLAPAVHSNDTPPLRAKNVLAEKEEVGRKASQNLKDFKQQVRRPALVEKPSDCGKCIVRIIDGKSMLATSPDCPTHGLGLGTAQEGRDRKGDSMYSRVTS